MDNTIKVIITDNEIQKLSRNSPEEGLIQIIANAIDADAKEVKITLYTDKNALIDTGTIDKIVIEDDGSGIEYTKVNEYFGQYGTSWKANKKRKDGRGYNGQQGKGRFKYLALGKNIQWETTYKKEGQNYSYSLLLKYQDPKNIAIDKQEASSNALGTVVSISSLCEKAQNLQKEKIIFTIIQAFGLYIKNSLGNFKIFLNEIEIQPDDYIEKIKNGSFNLDIEEQTYIFNYEFIVWKKNFDFKDHKHTFLYNNDGDYRASFASGVQASNYLPFHTVLIFSSYFEIFDEYTDSFTGITTKIKTAYRTDLTEFLFRIKRERSLEEFKDFKELDFYPFLTQPTNDVERAEKNIFDLCAFSILENDPQLLSDKNHSLKLLFKLLKKMVAKDDSILDNLSEILDLDEQYSAMLKSACRTTKLPQLIAHYSEIQRKQTFLSVLDSLVHDDFYKKNLRERTQLHKIVEKELWIFGEDLEYNLGTSDERLTRVIEQNIKINNLSEEDVNEIEESLKNNINDKESCLKRIPDLYLWKYLNHINSKKAKNIIIELKAPKVEITPSLIEQGENIYNGILTTSGALIDEANVWEYIFISSDISPKMASVYQGDPKEQVIRNYQNGNYKIKCMEWGEIIKEAEIKLNKIKKGLEIEITQEKKDDLLKKYLDDVNFRF